MIRRVIRNLILGGSVIAAMFRAIVTPSPRAERANGGIGRVIRRKAIEYALLFGALAILGFLAAAAGLIPTKASSGHWPITAWFLNFTMERSVATHSLTVDAPPLDDPALVSKGAAHYDIACRPCHGSPELRHPRVAAAMTPHPPYLPPLIGQYKPRELFYIVKHGVKFTGMPAWPAQEREDEVWAMTAFLLRLPKMNAEEYRRIANARVDLHAAAMPSLAPRILQTCAQCHGVRGEGGGDGAFPKLAGQRPEYLYNALLAFATGKRKSGIMQPIAAGLDRNQMIEAARYYSALPATPGAAHARSEIGGAIAHRGIPRQFVPACLDCHGHAGSRKNDAYPLLDGQYEDYLTLQLELFAKGHRGGSPYAHLMHDVAPMMTPQQMREVARYFAGR